MAEHRLPERDRPWVMRTYAGHSDARRSNELYRRNLAKGQTGLSVAFDLPTQTGYDPDHVLARGEVGKVGVSIVHKGDMHALFDGIPLDEMNTSMTINATAAWLLALYVDGRRGERRRPRQAQGHHPERHHQGVPVARHLRLPARALDAPDRRHGRLHRQRDAQLEPDQRLQLPPAGGGRHPGAGDRLRALDRDRRPRRDQGPRPGGRARTSPRSSAGSPSSSTPASGSSRSTRSSARWASSGSRSGATATASPSPSSCACATASRSTRSGSPSHSRRTTCPGSCSRRWPSRSAATPVPARSSFPAWNEALGLPRPWDQQWSLRIQQILANETDLLDYPDIFEGSKVDGRRSSTSSPRARARRCAPSRSTAARSRRSRT